MMRFTIGFTTGAVQLLGPRGVLVPRAERSAEGWAPLGGEKVCQDAAGRWRQEHSWDGDGKCIFCSAASPTEQLNEQAAERPWTRVS